jgi:hypothetical protein
MTWKGWKIINKKYRPTIGHITKGIISFCATHKRPMASVRWLVGHLEHNRNIFASFMIYIKNQN